MSEGKPLTIAGDIEIFRMNGVWAAGRLSGTGQPMPIEVPDLILLSPFAGRATEEEVISSITGGVLAGYFPNGAPPEQGVRGRIRQLRDTGVLTDAPQGARSEESALTLTDCPPVTPVADETRLRLGFNFLLRPTGDGFAVWSPRADKELKIDLDLILLLATFGDGARVSQALRAATGGADPDACRRAIAWALDQGLLVPADQDLENRIQPAKDGDHEGARPGAGLRHTRWRDIEPDGRIPVYFFPHMENHYPLALGVLFSALEAHEGGVLLDDFLLVPITYMSPQEFLEGPYRRFGRGIWLFSNYMWSVDLNLRVSEAVRKHDSGNLTIHGGPSTPGYREACEEFFQKHPSVDVAVHGEGERAIVGVLESLRRREPGGFDIDHASLQAVDGISFRDPDSNEKIVHTASRTRMRQPDSIPSPYLEGVFDVYDGRIDAAIIETNRGCPFACSFCDWGSATNQKVSKIGMDRVYEEIRWSGRNRVPVLWIADANFGMLPRDVEIAEWIAETKRELGYPREVVVNYTKNATSRLADIIRVLGEGGIISQGIISIQTTDEKTLDVINRKNIKTEKYDELIELFSEQGLPLSTDLMIGLPGITVDAFDRDLQRYVDADVAVKAYPTQLLPNSPMADPDYMRRYEIEVDDNGFLVSCYSYTREELRAMKDIFEVYVAAEGYCTLRYVMRYLQWDHGITALDFLHALYDAVRSEPDRYPAITWVLRFFTQARCMPGGWHRFYRQVGTFISDRYGISVEGGLRVALEVNELVMPEPGRRYPLRRELAHDFVSYFRSRNRLRPTETRPLEDYGPGDITVEDPDAMARLGTPGEQYDTHQYFWELISPIGRVRSLTRAEGADEGRRSA